LGRPSHQNCFANATAIIALSLAKYRLSSGLGHLAGLVTQGHLPYSALLGTLSIPVRLLVAVCIFNGSQRGSIFAAELCKFRMQIHVCLRRAFCMLGPSETGYRWITISIIRSSAIDMLLVSAYTVEAI
jgi:hypothetical protein